MEIQKFDTEKLREIIKVIRVHSQDEIEIECLPSDLISSVEVSIEPLKELNDTIIVADLVLPDTVTVLSEPESMVAKVEPPRIIEEDEEAGEEEFATSAEPEVLTASRRDEDE